MNDAETNMAQYGYCENCGSTLELVGCPNCDEVQVNEYINDLSEINSQIYTSGKE